MHNFRGLGALIRRGRHIQREFVLVSPYQNFQVYSCINRISILYRQMKYYLEQKSPSFCLKPIADTSF